MKKVLLFTVILLLCFALAKHVQDNKSSVSGNPHPLPSKELTVQEFKAAREKYLDLANEKNPKSALGELRRDIQTNGPLLRSCHALVHEIGHNAYEKYGDFGEAVKYKDEICNSGYLHGIIESHFAKSPDIESAMRTVCDSYPAEKYISWECYHGVGHGAMYYTSNDLPRSLELCTRFENTFSRKSCVNGVFMENFNSDQKIHLSKFLKKSDPFYPCQQQQDDYKNDCYLYAPTYYLSLNKNNYREALDWCDTAEPHYKTACVQGVGAQAVKENISNPELVEETCMGGKFSQTQPCIHGMVNLYINHHGSLEPAEELCKKLHPSNRRFCQDTIKSNALLF